MSAVQRTLFGCDECLAEDYGFCERCTSDLGAELIDDRLLCRTCAQKLRDAPKIQSDSDYLFAYGHDRYYDYD